MADALTAEGVLEAYFAAPRQTRARMRWVMSEQTAEALREQLAQEDEPYFVRPEGSPPILVGRPVRIDDAAEGLSYEPIND